MHVILIFCLLYYRLLKITLISIYINTNNIFQDIAYCANI